MRADRENPLRLEITTGFVVIEKRGQHGDELVRIELRVDEQEIVIDARSQYGEVNYDSRRNNSGILVVSCYRHG
ncbi:hypothetical protein A3A39_02610 [Candidatus Kaiserbacteria bacterium RIFCSPLOWO2_01_FULL_54_13]|uniref:Uncharacterized protein n=1 Tax=Candidatus Kaiserbacteria bacterium RIFCSPLOWO2_01_FULL_54_13 TaxID=1798512 RepID=A0A1F6F3K6_9BACT|nr:MAG: hypothetical protein A3A39_02610 [Candidatus Kaiserbacteria bacterium RIFCSPLOWO2_01_FULL_54_13]